MSLAKLLIFYGGISGSPVEEMLAEALAEEVLDSLEKIVDSGVVEGAVLVTDRREMTQRCPPDIEVDVDQGPFHFGNRLAEVVRRHNLERVIYLGAGCAPLMQHDDFFSLGHYLRMAWSTVLTNNLYSADLVAFVPGEALSQIELPPTDNNLAMLLRDQAGLVAQELPRRAATQFNIDSPADLAILKLIGGAGPRLEAWLERAALDVEPYQRILAAFADSDAEVLVAGRVGSQVWQHLEKETACRVRIFAEERGMQASGRQAARQARSLLAYHLQEVGCSRFFEELATLADVALIDSRVILAHLGLAPSRADRFLSDLARHDQITDPFLREFTEAAANAPIPVVLGGHSLVAGGLMALIEKAWSEHNAAAAANAAS